MPDFMPRYLSRFACIGSACEDTCCKDWRVYVDEKHYKKLKHAMSGTKTERALFSRAHQRVRGSERSASRYALIVLDETRHCPLLSAERRCTVHERHGAEVLANTCAFYPRQIQEFEGRQEMTATLSCPEIARQALLHDDALDLVPARHALGGRPMTGAPPATPKDDLYLHCLNEVREIVFHLLSARGYPLATRLFFLSYFAERTRARFRSEDADPGAVADAYAALADPDALISAARHFDSIEIPTAIAAALVVDILKGRLLDLPTSTFRQLVGDVVSGQEGVALDAPGGTLVDVSPTHLWEQHRARLASFTPELRARIDRYFDNYARNYWLREWYTGSPDLFVHTRRLLMRIALLRFLLIGHPRLSGGFDQTTLDATAVEVFYKFSRGIEHSPTFLDRIDEILDTRGFTTLAHVVYLLKF